MLGFKENAREIDEESRQRSLAKTKQVEAEIEEDRAMGYLVGSESNEWRKKQDELIDSFLVTMTEDVFETTSGTIKSAPLFKDSKAWIGSIRGDIENRKQQIKMPGKLVKGGKLNIEPFAELKIVRTHFYKGMMCQSQVIYPILVESNDPPFEIPKGKAVYETQSSGKKVFYVLIGDTLHLATESGQVMEREWVYEGHKAKLARLAAEEAERKRLEELERMKREQEAEDARQASQLDKLKSLPSEKFANLMKLING